MIQTQKFRQSDTDTESHTVIDRDIRHSDTDTDSHTVIDRNIVQLEYQGPTGS